MDSKLDLKTILDLHAKWLRCEAEGQRANLSRANLSGADLSRANLSGANLSRANLSGADLSWANLSRANLSGANLSGADLSGATLSWANLSGADLSRADLSGANLSGATLSWATLSWADLSWANLSGANLFRANLSWANLSRANLSWANLSGADLSRADLSGANLSWANLKECTAADLALAIASHLPEGPFHAWKKCKNGVLVKLLIPEDAKRSHGAERKCRASKAVVLEVIGAEVGISLHDGKTEYRVGQTVLPDGWDEDRWNTCGQGIHFYITKLEALAHS